MMMVDFLIIFLGTSWDFYFFFIRGSIIKLLESDLI